MRDTALPPVADERAVSPVVGVALLVAIAVLLATVIGAVLFTLDLGSAGAPSATLSFDVVGDDVLLTHEGGDPLDADRIAVRDGDGNSLDGLDADLQTGDSEVIVQNVTGVETVTVVWQDPETDAETALATFEP